MSSIYYSDIKTEFSKICPNSSRSGKESTIVKQNKILDPPGLTIVAHIEEHEAIPFNYAISKILNSGRKFNPNRLLHFTLLGLFDGKRKNTMCDTDAIIKSSKQFIENRQIGPLTIHFNLVRLGAFYHNGRPCDGDSDGTVVAMAAQGSQRPYYPVMHPQNRLQSLLLLQ